MKKIYFSILFVLGISAAFSGCVSSANAPTAEPLAPTLIAQTNEKLMTLLANKQTSGPTATSTLTATPVPPTSTPLPSLTFTAVVPPGSTPTASMAVPSLTRTITQNCLSAFLVGVVGSKWDSVNQVWALEETAGLPVKVTFDVRNTGTCSWDPSFKFKYWSGEHMSGPNYVNLPHGVAPNDHIFIDINIISPAGNGFHHGYWTMESSDGKTFPITFMLTILIK
jgi:hypothetical protein